MKFSWFHLMPYRWLPDNFRERYHRLFLARSARGDTTGATQAAQRRDAIDAINYGQLNTRIEGASNPTALRAIIPTELADEPPPSQNPNVRHD